MSDPEAAVTVIAKPLGFWSCTALVIGNIIGMGIFMLPASLAPFGLNAFLGWGITVLGCVFIANVFANFARALPEDDGPYGYTRRAFGNGAAFFIMWCYWVSIWITNATIAVGVVGYLVALFPVLNTHPYLPPALGLSAIWIFVFISVLGARTSGQVQVVSTALKLLPMFAVMLLGAVVLFTDPHSFAVNVPVTPLSLESTAAAGTVALFAMLGVECATIPAGKVEQPDRTIPRATLFGTLVTAGVYVGVSAVSLLLIPQQQLTESTAPFVDLFQRYIGGGAGRWVAVFVVISGLGALNGWTMIGGEVTASFARNGVFPAALNRYNRHGAPVGGLVLCGALASVMVVMNYSRSLAQAFTFLSVMVSAATLPLYLLGGLALLKLWRRGAVQGNWLMVASAIICVLFALWAGYGMGQEAVLWAILLGAIGFFVFIAMRRRRVTE